MLFRRELIAKIRLEFELWCSLVEAFAPSPFNKESVIYVNFNEFPQHVTPQHYQQCVKSRTKMQQEALGFVPNTKTLQEILFKRNQPQSMDRSAVDAFNGLSTAMGKLYEDVYMVADRIHQQREMVRSHLENIVSQCDAFPPGTRVLVFGSSANGFGSPTSDLDMCLQMPPNTKLPGEQDDPTGAKAMGQLAQALESNSMQNVDTARLTARIPIIMFNCPRPTAKEGENELMECDLSFLNSLAVLNTSLLLSYSRIHPVTRVLAGSHHQEMGQGPRHQQPVQTHTEQLWLYNHATALFDLSPSKGKWSNIVTKCGADVEQPGDIRAVASQLTVDGQRLA